MGQPGRSAHSPGVAQQLGMASLSGSGCTGASGARQPRSKTERGAALSGRSAEAAEVRMTRWTSTVQP
jgi:hypothetical protein